MILLDENKKKLIDNDKSLYHYTNSKTAIEYILPSRKLRFNKFENLRDQVENFIPFVGAVGSGEGDIIEDYPKIFEAVKAKISKLKVACFCSNEFNINNTPSTYIESRINELQDDILKKTLLPFKHGYEKDRMWYQYADNYSGVCLVFDREYMLNNIKSMFQEKEYNGKYINYVFNYKSNLDSLNMNNEIKDEAEKYLELLCFTKPIDYKDECEFRIVINNDSDEYFNMNYKSSLRAIILGHNLPNEYYCIYKELINQINSDIIDDNKILLLKYKLNNDGTDVDYIISEID